MESQSDAVLDPPNELRVRVCRRGRQSAPTRLATYRQDVAERKLQPAPIAPRPDSVGELNGLSAALESESYESVRHEAFAESRVHRSEHEVSSRRPDQL